MRPECPPWRQTPLCSPRRCTVCGAPGHLPARPSVFPSAARSSRPGSREAPPWRVRILPPRRVGRPSSTAGTRHSAAAGRAAASAVSLGHLGARRLGPGLRSRLRPRFALGEALGASTLVLSERRLTNLPSSTGGIFTATSSPSGLGSLSSSIGTTTATTSARTIAPTRRRRARRFSSSRLASSAAVMA